MAFESFCLHYAPTEHYVEQKNSGLRCDETSFWNIRVRSYRLGDRVST
jgi:hypothetical protein